MREPDLVAGALHPRLHELEILRIAQAHPVQALRFGLAHVTGSRLGIGIGVLVVTAERVPMRVAGALHRVADVVAGERHEALPRRICRGKTGLAPTPLTAAS